MNFSNSFICVFLLYFSGYVFMNVVPTNINKNSSFLIVGTSVPSVIVGWVLSHYDLNVTMSFSTEDVDNYISSTKNIVNGKTFVLPKMQPRIFENSKLSQKLVNTLKKDLHSENGFYITFQNKKQISVNTEISVKNFINNLVSIGCLKESEERQLDPFVSALANYNYTLYNSIYSNITLTEFATKMKAPRSFMDCAINLLTINAGISKNTFNAADALARINFYFYQSKDSLKSYYLKSERIFSKPIKGIIDQMVEDMKSKNVKFIANHTTNEFYIDAKKGKILGDLSDTSKIYDFVILGDDLISTKRILQNTYVGNSGVPKIFQPLEKILNKLNKYSPSLDVASIKIWLSVFNIWNDHVIEVNDSHFPYSIQSIALLSDITMLHNLHVILEVIVVGTNGSRVMDWNKIDKELAIYFPKYNVAKIVKRVVNWVDFGVLMDVKYGTNRLYTSSIQEAGISNLILAGGWLNPINSTACDLERDVFIAKNVLRNLKFII